MWKIFVLLLIALGFGLSRPTSREVILDFVSPAMNPLYRFMTNQELKRIVTDLESTEDETKTLPYRDGEFEAWLAREYDDETRATDAWETPYTMEVEISTFTVTSAGPDRAFATEDDLSVDGVRGVTDP